MKITVRQLKNLISEALVNESPAWKRHGVDFDPLADLKKWVDRGTYVHFGSINKLGVNPQFAYTHPLGIHAFVFNQKLLDEIMSGDVRFAGDREYMHIFRPKIPSAVVKSDQISDEQVEEMADELVDAGRVEQSTAVKALSKGSAYEKLLAVTKAAGGNTLKWSMALRGLGIEGLHDEKRDIAVFFGKDTIEHLDTVDNPNKA
jgi:hypothetical protein